MKNKIAIIFILLFFSTITVGKQSSNLIADASPEIIYILNGVVQTNAAIAKIGTRVFSELSDRDTTLIEQTLNMTTTNDSGKFNLKFTNSLGFKNAVRIAVPNGADTIRSAWMFTQNVPKQELTGTFTSNDCNSRKKIIPTAEIYTFPPQTIIVP